MALSALVASFAIPCWLRCEGATLVAWRAVQSANETSEFDAEIHRYNACVTMFTPTDYRECFTRSFIRMVLLHKNGAPAWERCSCIRVVLLHKNVLGLADCPGTALAVETGETTMPGSLLEPAASIKKTRLSST